MKLYYIRTNGFDLVLVTNGDRAVHTTDYEMRNDDFYVHKFVSIRDEDDVLQRAALRYLISVAEFNDFADLYGERCWSSCDPDYWMDQEVIAVYDTVSEKTEIENELIKEVNAFYDAQV